MFIKTCIRKKDGKEFKTHYLTETYRDKTDKKIKHRHLASLSKLPEEQILALKAVFQDKSNKNDFSLDQLEVIDSKEYGNIAIFNHLFDKYFSNIIDDEFKNEIKAIVINKIFDPKSKNSLDNWIKQVDLGFRISNRNNLYQAIDYLAENQEAIEKKLIKRHKIQEKELVLYDITSTYFEGQGAKNICKYGYSRDHRPDRVQVNIGLVTDEIGVPVRVEVFAGNISDKATLQDKVTELKDKFKINKITFVFDRGMKSKVNLEHITQAGYHYITALSHSELKKKAEENTMIQLSIFDKQDLAEFVIEDKKYLLCHNPVKEMDDKQTRAYLINKTESSLKKIQNFKKSYSRQQLQDKVSKVINRYKCEKYIIYQIIGEEKAKLEFQTNWDKIELDNKYSGFYMLETTDTKLQWANIEDKYKSLQLVERAFDDIKNIIKIRPVFHRLEPRIKGHIFSCFMSYYLLHQFRKQSWALLKKHTLDEILGELKGIKKVYFKISRILIEKISKLNDTQKELFNIFWIKYNL